MASLFVYIDIGLHPPPGYRRRVVTISPATVPTGNPCRQRREVDEFLTHLEWLADGIYDDGWQHLNNDMITSIHSFPLEWTSVMRRVVVACDYLRRVVRGDLPTEDESSEEDDDTK